MAKYDEVENDTEKLFDKVLDGSTIPQHLCNIKLLSNDKLKTPYKVAKANDITAHMSGYDVFVIVNEIIFFYLEENQRQMLLDEALAQVFVNGETGSIKLVKPDVSTFSGIIDKYGLEEWNRTQECVKSAKDIKKNQDAETEDAPTIT